MGRLDQKVAVITGGARGMGKQMAITFAREGADIVICDLREMEATSKEVKNLGRKIIAVKSDISKQQEVKNLIDTAIDNFKKVDILVNNAAMGDRLSLLEMTEESWDAIMNVNLKGAFLCTQAVAKHMMERKYGKIINIASTSGLRPAPMVGYAVSKAGVIQLTMTCAGELGPYGINVNAIAPGVVLTDLTYIGRTPAQVEAHVAARSKEAFLRRVGNPQDIANLALFLASDESSYITGQVVICDGGRVGMT